MSSSKALRITGGYHTFRPIVSIALIERNHLLMVQHGSGSDRGRWNLPGGKVDAGESLTTAAVREAREETGHRVHIDGLGGLFTYVNRSGTPCLRILFHGSITGGKPRIDGDEIVDVRWFHLDQVRTMKDHELCKPALLRRILTTLRRPSVTPLSVLHELSPRLAIA